MTVNSAEAAIYNVGGIDYDVTTISGIFNDLAPDLIAQVWWGDSLLANDFAAIVGDGLGLPNSLMSGPYFSFGFGDFFGIEVVESWTFSNGDVALQDGLPREGYATFAIATAVPLPAGGLLLLSGLAGVVGLNRRKKHLA